MSQSLSQSLSQSVSWSGVTRTAGQAGCFLVRNIAFYTSAQVSDGPFESKVQAEMLAAVTAAMERFLDDPEMQRRAISALQNIAVVSEPMPIFKVVACFCVLCTHLFALRCGLILSYQAAALVSSSVQLIGTAGGECWFICSCSAVHGRCRRDGGGMQCVQRFVS